MFDDTDLRASYILLTSVRNDLTESQEIGRNVVCWGTRLRYGRSLSTAKPSAPCALSLAPRKLGQIARISSAAGEAERADDKDQQSFLQG